MCRHIFCLLKVSDIICHYSACLLKFRDPYMQDFRQGFKCKWFILEFISGVKKSNKIANQIRRFLSIKLPWKFNHTKELMNQCRKCALELSHPRNKQIKVFLKKFCTPVLAITPRGKLISRSKLLLAYHLSRSNNPNSERKQRNESASSCLVFTEVLKVGWYRQSTRALTNFLL